MRSEKLPTAVVNEVILACLCMHIKTRTRIKPVKLIEMESRMVLNMAI
jgi:hypothetical protein